MTSGTPLYVATFLLNLADKEHPNPNLSLGGLEGIWRLLLQVEAVRAVSWLWPSDVPFTVHVAAEGTSKTTTTSVALIRMLPILRRRSRRPRALLAGLFR